LPAAADPCNPIPDQRITSKLTSTTSRRRKRHRTVRRRRHRHKRLSPVSWRKDLDRRRGTRSQHLELYPDPEPDLETEAVSVIEYWDEITNIVPKEAKERTAVNDDIYGEELRIAGELDAWAEDSGGLFEEPSGWQPVIMAERAFPVDQ